VSVIARPKALAAIEEQNGAGRRAPVGALALFRRHWPIVAVLLGGLLVRVAVMAAYTPYFWFTDTNGYLAAARNGVPEAARPFAYPAFLWLFEHLGFGLRGIVGLQHLLGLGASGLLYAFLVRRRVTPWIAALAAVPLALSPLLVNIEHHLLSDPLFVALYMGAPLVLAWWDRLPPLWACGLAGLLTAAASLTRQVGLVMVTLIVGYMLVRRFDLRRVVAFTASFALPLLLYVFWMHQVHGVYAVTTWRGKHLYARVAPIAQCGKLGELTARERQLCDDRPLDRRPGPEGYLWVGGEAPARALPDRVDLAFARKVIVHQPFDYLGMVASDVTHVFYPGQKQRRGEPCVAYWAFPDQAPGGCRTDAVGTRMWAEHPFRVNEPVAKALRVYARLDYLVGPFFLACIVLVTFAALRDPRRPERRRRVDAVFFCLLGLGAMVGAIATANFSYRYTVALYCTLTPAAALALTDLVARRRHHAVGERT
jgi:hypothetical protein